MRSRRLLWSGLIGLVVAGGVLAGSQAERWRGMRLPPMTAQELGLDQAQADRLLELQSRQRAYRLAAYDTVGGLLRDARVELDAPEPLLNSISVEFEQTVMALALEQRSLKAERMAFYQSLDADQQARVHAHLRQQLDRLEHLHARLGSWIAQTP